MQVLKSLIQEAVRTVHFNQRVSQRFYPENIEPDFDFSIIAPHLDLIESIEFDGEFNVGIRVFRSKEIYIARVPDKDQVSQGNTLWVIVRGNEMETIMFNSGQAPQNTNYQVTIDRLSDMAQRKNYVLSRTDFEAQRQGEGGRRKAPKLELPTIDIEGKRWFVDTENQRIIYSKNTKNTIGFDDFFDMADEEEALKYINAISMVAA